MYARAGFVANEDFGGATGVGVEPGPGLGNARIGRLGVENYIATANIKSGKYQCMLNLMHAVENDNRGPDVVDNGANFLLAYHGGPISGDTGSFKLGVMAGKGLGAQLRDIGGNGDLIDDATALRAFAYGTVDLGPNLSFAPAFIGEKITDALASGHDETWATFNGRFNYEINQNVAWLTEATYMWADVDNHPTQGSYDGEIYKLVTGVALKLDVGGGDRFLRRPELRATVGYLGGSSALIPDRTQDVIFGLQMETWF